MSDNEHSDTAGAARFASIFSQTTIELLLVKKLITLQDAINLCDQVERTASAANDSAHSDAAEIARQLGLWFRERAGQKPPPPHSH